MKKVFCFFFEASLNILVVIVTQHIALTVIGTTSKFNPDLKSVSDVLVDPTLLIQSFVLNFLLSILTFFYFFRIFSQIFLLKV